MKPNPCLENIAPGYLFPEIAKRRSAYQQAHPELKVISLGVGNTTEPLFDTIADGLVREAQALATAEGYSGYQDEGSAALRQKISEVFYGGRFSIDEIFISDGAKGDVGRLQLLFGAGTPVAVQDPAYPVYVDGSVLIGAGGPHDGTGYAGIAYLPCTPENKFFPDLAKVAPGSLLYICSPNNPTGYVMTRAQLEALVAFANANGAVIIFDAAYSEFIRDKALPKTIFEIAGADACAIEINSFSKPAGFTGVRLGWTALPFGLKYDGGGSVNKAWSRVTATIFNGASNIAQAGGLAALSEKGLQEIRALTDYYLENAHLIKQALEDRGIRTIGGYDSPYVWAQFPGRTSWDVFDELLTKYNIVTTPGSGFGPAGESFVRFSAFGHHADVREACARLAKG
ncbi:MAG: LL-diaminopimelate aminotransferase [Clostridiales Family XIII bacterium]|jgi:LL-diaminopimelate aminotransferase|nr:LL-diaminopimelate aminotransferase [Clostridiales Family XIII bacterium]